jgi:peptide-methionine (S)-S-oxide reductase
MTLFASPMKLRLPRPEDALPGRDTPMPVPDTHFVNGNRITPPFPDGLQQAVFGMGCFWGAERKFWQAPGVYSTAVGYAGGYTPNPTYKEVCSGLTGHAEVVLVVFDPKITSYDEMLRIFWENHDPTQGMRQGNDIGTQYRSTIYCADAAQREAAERSRAAYQRHHRDPGRAALLLRRGVSPAVPGEKPGRVLRDRWYWSELSIEVESGDVEGDLLRGCGVRRCG